MDFWQTPFGKLLTKTGYGPLGDIDPSPVDGYEVDGPGGGSGGGISPDGGPISDQIAKHKQKGKGKEDDDDDDGSHDPTYSSDLYSADPELVNPVPESTLSFGAAVPTIRGITGKQSSGANHPFNVQHQQANDGRGRYDG